ncbi:hypothetical protein HAPAU_24930 [Halalkalicoccus paucihalophilus]|uniref:Uncharacterized protein n=1 Tax=Halalkalicoccus paucihalophilus TaxID=1008153 RepID=A0A151ADU7_9EURY|nr:hypothetical protein [Halalkalicoccus paucihalophilus]KYH25815.1 hypothetical protein HAPAU_24930 [Halalkalicoccus paucihalophilus]
MTAEKGLIPSVGEFIEYCRTQSRLLRGSVETMGSEADELLEGITERTAEVRTRLDGAKSATPQSAAGPNDDSIDVAAVEEMEEEIEREQAVLEAKQARIDAFRDLAGGYDDLAEELRSDVDDGREAMERIVEFEAQRGAPAYFEERTVLEAATSNGFEDDRA